MSKIIKCFLDFNNKTVKVHAEDGILAIPIYQLINEKVDDFDNLLNALILLPSIFDVVDGGLIIPNELSIHDNFGVI